MRACVHVLTHEHGLLVGISEHDLRVPGAVRATVQLGPHDSRLVTHLDSPRQVAMQSLWQHISRYGNISVVMATH